MDIQSDRVVVVVVSEHLAGCDLLVRSECKVSIWEGNAVEKVSGNEEGEDGYD